MSVQVRPIAVHLHSKMPGVRPVQHASGLRDAAGMLVAAASVVGCWYDRGLWPLKLLWALRRMEVDTPLAGVVEGISFPSVGSSVSTHGMEVVTPIPGMHVPFVANKLRVVLRVGVGVLTIVKCACWYFCVLFVSAPLVREIIVLYVSTLRVQRIADSHATWVHVLCGGVH